MSDLTAHDPIILDRCEPAYGTAEQARLRGLAALTQAFSDAGARCAHPMAPPVAHLCLKVRRYDAADPDWPDADRIVACGPEGAAMLAAVGRLLDPDGTEAEARGGERAECGIARGGQGVALATGLAWAERAMAARFGRSLADHRTFGLTTGEELATGLALEAAQCAADAQLNKLTLIAEAGPDASVARAYATMGFAVRHADGGDPLAVAAAFAAAQRSRKPTLLLFEPARMPLAAAREVHEGAAVWAQAAARGAAARRAWRKRLAVHGNRVAFERAIVARGPDAEECEAPLPAVLARLGALPEVALVASAQARRLLGDLPGCVAAGAAAVAVANGIAAHGGMTVLSVCLAHEAEAGLPALRYAAAHGLRVAHLVAPGAERGLGCVLTTVGGLAVELPGTDGAGKCVAQTLRWATGPSVIVPCGAG